MYLKSLSTQPNEVFDEITFDYGVNLVFGKKDQSDDPKKSLNGIGKSLFFDLIDFCLLSATDYHRNKRLSQAFNHLKDNRIILKIEIDDEIYIIERSVETPNTEIAFGKLSNPRFYTYNELKPVLTDLLFKREDYIGKYSNSWLRQLIPFFIKVEKPKKTKFIDPIKYSEYTSEMEALVYHFFLLNIDNSLLYKNWQYQTDFKQVKNNQKGIKKVIEETYGLKDIDQAQNEITKLETQSARLERDINNYQLAAQYQNVEEQANELTGEIKKLWYENYANREKIKEYKDSYQSNKDQINIQQITKIYKELDERFAQQVKTSLEEAQKFREYLSLSRKEFLQDEINALSTDITDNESKISKLETERAELFNFLEAKKAINDLSEAFLQLSRNKDRLSELRGQVKLYTDLLHEQTDIKGEIVNLEKELLNFLEEIKDSKVASFREQFTDIYNSVYSMNKDESIFNIHFNEYSDSRISIEISFPGDSSKGKNQGRTLVYDLSVLFNAINKDLKMPRFLIHDGIFDGMDKAHFVHVYQHLKELEKVQKFQYFVSMNEEGTLSENFGNVEDLTPEKLADEAILVLTPSSKLLGVNF